MLNQILSHASKFPNITEHTIAKSIPENYIILKNIPQNFIKLKNILEFPENVFGMEIYSRKI